MSAVSLRTSPRPPPDELLARPTSVSRLVAQIERRSRCRCTSRHGLLTESDVSLILRRKQPVHDTLARLEKVAPARSARSSRHSRVAGRRDGDRRRHRQRRRDRQGDALVALGELARSRSTEDRGAGGPARPAEETRMAASASIARASRYSLRVMAASASPPSSWRCWAGS